MYQTIEVKENKVCLELAKKNALQVYDTDYIKQYAKFMQITESEAIICMGEWLRLRQLTGKAAALIRLFYLCEIFGFDENELIIKK